MSHLPRNSSIFSSADLAIGVDVLSDCLPKVHPGSMGYNALLPCEVIFASEISAHFCAFRLRGVSSIEHMPAILSQGRASLAAATSSAIFLLTGSLSFSFYALFSVCSVSTAVPHIPILGAFLYLQIILPLVGLPMAMSDPDRRGMQQVPAKNDASVSFGKKEGKTFYLATLMKALLPAIFPQLLYLIAFGELMIEYEPQFLELHCNSGFQRGDWTSVVRCRGVSDYSGGARDSAVALSLGELILCTIVTSASFVYRTLPIFEEPPWKRNHIWVVSLVFGCIILAAYLLLNVERGSFASLPWYYFLLALVMPVFCVAWDEYIKQWERQVLGRAEKLRRLQFETRLGMWSPK
jgi:magnesium-transporting ATPase (P-type)